MIQPVGSCGYGVTRNWRRTISLGVADSFCNRSSPFMNAAAPESMNRIQLGTQLAPSSIAPNFRFRCRSRTPSMISTDIVCHSDSGMVMKLVEVKFSAPP
jgi:hypothetical protein